MSFDARTPANQRAHLARLARIVASPAAPADITAAIVAGELHNVEDDTNSYAQRIRQQWEEWKRQRGQ